MPLFLSPISSIEPVIDDRNYAAHVRLTVNAGFSRGWEENDGSDGFGDPFPRDLYIPRGEWAPRIEEMTAKGQLPSQIAKALGIPYHNQARTNFCWAFGFTHAAEMAFAGQGQDYVGLSPASVAAPITNYRNVGGWGTKAQAYATEHGFCPEKLWPVAKIDRSLDTPESRKAREAFRVRECFTLPRGDFGAVMSCLLRGWCVPIGLGWWGHLVCAFDPIARGSDSFGLRFRNSWLNYGDNGYGVLDESKASPNDACCPLVGTTRGIDVPPHVAV